MTTRPRSLVSALRYTTAARLTRNGLVVFTLAAFMACGSSDGGEQESSACTPQETRTCVGPAACAGGQACLADGSGWTQCDCGSSAGGTGAQGGSGGASSGGSTGAGGSPGADGGVAGNGGVSGTAGVGGGGSSGVGGSAGIAGSSSGGTSGSANGGTGGVSGAGGLPAHCSNLPGPSMVDMGGWCIDSTEVTRAQYLDFLAAKNGDVSGQITLCKDTNTSYDPTCTWGTQYPNRPANCVHWCDAYAYCEWAGKRLCGHKLGGPLKASTAAIVTDWTVSQWAHACTNGGLTTYPYANTFIGGACDCFTPKEVASYPQCHGLQSPYSEVWDLVGNAGEWVDYQTGSSWPQSSFAYVGKNGTGTSDCACASYATSQTGESTIGFRCCSL